MTEKVERTYGRDSASSCCYARLVEEGDDLVMHVAVATNGGVVKVRGLAMAVGEGPASGFNDGTDSRQIVRGDADCIDCNVHCSLGNEHVLPKVAVSARTARLLLKRDEPIGKAETIPPSIVSDAHLRVTECIDA